MARLIVQVSAAMNMVKFREDQMKYYAELHEPRARIMLALDELQLEHADLLAQLEQVKMDHEELNRMREDAMHECEEMELQIAHVNEQQRAQRVHHNELKQRATEWNDKLVAAQWELQHVQSNLVELQAQVVSSPDRPQAQLQRAQQQLASIKQECVVLKETLQQRKEVHKPHVLQAKEMVQSFHALATDVHHVGTLYQQEQQELEQQQQQHVQNVQTRLQIVQKELGDAEQVLQSTQMQFHQWENCNGNDQRPLVELQNTLQTRRIEVQVAEQEREQDLKRIQQGHDEIQRLQQELILEQDDNTTQYHQPLLQQYIRIQQVFVQTNQQRPYKNQ